MSPVDKEILQQLREMRSEHRELRRDVAVVALDVAELKARQAPKDKQLVRDGGLAAGGGAVVAAIVQIVELLK